MNELGNRFLDREEILYAEKADSAAANAGFKRIEIQVHIKSQRVDFVRVHFTRNARADSVDIQVGSRSGTFSRIIEDMPASEYLFQLVSFDKYGNRSLPYEVSGKAVGDNFLNMLVNRSLSSVDISGTHMTIGWGGAPSYALWSEVIYTNTSGQTVTVIVPADETGTEITDFGGGLPEYTTLFLPDENSIDTLRVDASNLIIFREQGILAANGIVSPADALDNVRKLVYPLHTPSFMDLYYFPNLDSLDLTGYGLKNVMPSLLYNRNSVQTMCGGGSWQPFMRRVEKPADMRIANLDILQNLLESGQLKWLRYIPGTMELDQLLEPYVASGTVKLVQDDDPVFFPNEVYIEPQFFVKGQVVDNNWEMENYYSGDYLPRPGYSDIGKFNPGSETVNGDPVNLHLEQLIQSDGKNIYKCIIRKQSASFAMNLPKEYMYDSQRYGYLKFKMFCGSSAETMSASNYGEFLQPWIRPMNYMWNFGGNSAYGQQNWDVSFSSDRINAAQIRTEWKEYTVDMSPNNWWANDNTSNRRNRCIVFNIGHEASSFAYDGNNQVILYIADIRLSKTP
jgi:hypothetical protein